MRHPMVYDQKIYIPVIGKVTHKLYYN